MDLSTDWPRVVGAAFGVLLAVVGLGTLVGVPWSNIAGGAGFVLLRAVGSLLTLAVGAGIVYLAVGEELAEAA